eukprot:12112151-Ditylum_brightwellii.AAC.1
MPQSMHIEDLHMNHSWQSKPNYNRCPSCSIHETIHCAYIVRLALDMYVGIYIQPISCVEKPGCVKPMGWTLTRIEYAPPYGQ